VERPMVEQAVCHPEAEGLAGIAGPGE